MQPRMSMITLGVADLNASIDFYQNTLGFPRLGEEDTVAFFELNGTWLGLYPRDALAEDAHVSAQGSGFNSFTISHNVASEKEVDDIIATLKNAGTTILKEPQKVFWGGYGAYFADPDGHLWEVAYNPFTWIGPKDE